MENVKPSESGANPFVISRTVHAPRELVWKAWTESDRLKAWTGPKTYTTPVYNMDLRVGGRYLICMISGDGQEVWSTGTILEIVPNEKLVMTDSFSDDQGHVVSASYYGMGSEFPLESRVILTLTIEGHLTKFTLKYEDVSSVPEEHLLGMQQGWSESFDKLEAYLTRNHIFTSNFNKIMGDLNSYPLSDACILYVRCIQGTNISQSTIVYRHDAWQSRSIKTIPIGTTKPICFCFIDNLPESFIPVWIFTGKKRKKLFCIDVSQGKSQSYSHERTIFWSANFCLGAGFV